MRAGTDSGAAFMRAWIWLSALVAIAAPSIAEDVVAQTPSPQQQAFRDIYRELAENDRLLKQLAAPGAQ
jgi:hypothetical protein